MTVAELMQRLQELPGDQELLTVRILRTVKDMGHTEHEYEPVTISRGDTYAVIRVQRLR